VVDPCTLSDGSVLVVPACFGFLMDQHCFFFGSLPRSENKPLDNLLYEFGGE